MSMISYADDVDNDSTLTAVDSVCGRISDGVNERASKLVKKR